MPSTGRPRTLAGDERASRLRLVAICTVSVLALLGAGCGESVPLNGPARVAAGPPSVGVVTIAASYRPVALEIEAIGTALANESVEITSKTTNTITAIRFEEGQLVQRGAVLVEFDSAQARAELAEAEAALVESESQYRRSKDLFATRALSQAQLDQLEAIYKANQARVAAARARLEDTIIRAPFTGRTGFRRVSVGSLVSPGTVITTLDDTSVIKLDFTVPQTFIYALEPGLPITAQTAGLPNRTFSGRVTTLGSRIDPVTRSITVRAELPNEDGTLRPGMFMTVTLRAQEVNALMIPEAAIVPEQGKTFVYVVENDVARRREVTIGRRTPGEVEIITGLAESERVIIEGTQKVRDHVRVHEVDADQVSAVAAIS